MKIIASRTVCIGAGQCVFSAPESFDQDDDGKVVVLDDSPEPGAALAAVREAVEVCPSRALSLVAD
ncbi:ferredoxin [Herbiconiux daphne]|uniref:Ferredoxin n=1 Tax=Herbiconiux daphne TaxID=2970914 RepID=A0ABT2H829_9MICO|nr:ferredoxin [Herbiconiux daphne]MCS5736076.1 ferredoxin [Herbiconiux daphne]